MSASKKINSVRTVETSAAIIKFTGAADDDFSGSESGDDSPLLDDDVNVSGLPANVPNGVETQTSPSKPLIEEEMETRNLTNQNQNSVSQEPPQDNIEVNGKVEANGVIRNNERFNPFDRELQDVEDHFKEETPVKPEQKEDSLSEDSFFSRESDPPPTEDVSNAVLGLAEDHFSQPEGMFGMSTIEELDMAIQNCKEMVLDSQDGSDRRKNLVHKLIQLRMKLADAKEGPIEEEEDVKIVVGHRFKKRLAKSSKHYCEKCASVIWGVLQSWYKCTACGFCCHDKCLNLIYRTCASVKVAENPNYILSISPEKGLGGQNYRCAECSTPISFLSGHQEPRQCDYTGAYYCRKCHWNDTMLIPARVLHNWDLEPRKVCRASKQFLRIMAVRACIRVQDINPMLFNFVEELDDVRRMREEILIMKKYFLSCQDALESKLLLQLQQRQHFVENSDIYSLQDLIDVAEDVLLPELAKIHSSFAQHIKTDCQRCQAKGYMCELCDMREVLFPFDNIAIVCDRCTTVLHRHCFFRRNRICPKCERISRRAAHTTEFEESVEDS